MTHISHEYLYYFLLIKQHITVPGSKVWTPLGERGNKINNYKKINQYNCI